MTKLEIIRAFQLSLRAAVGAGAALVLAQLFRMPYPFYALVAAVIVTDLSPRETRKLAAPRLFGTAVGAALGAVLGWLLFPAVWITGIGIFIAMFVTQLMGLQSAARVAGYVCGVVLLHEGPEYWTYAWGRTLETVLGIVLAVLVSFTPKLLRVSAEGEANPPQR